ncbi:MAG: caspase family protein, partial [Pseudomonadota bacterium]
MCGRLHEFSRNGDGMATVRKCAWLGGLAAALISVSAAAAKVDVLPGDNIGYDTDRIALVMGNSDYEHIVDLDNTVNDSRAVADALRKVGFKVFRAENMTRRDMNDAIDAYLAAVTPGSEALIYYAGHGLEVAGENYLLPTDISRLCWEGSRRR